MTCIATRGEAQGAEITGFALWWHIPIFTTLDDITFLLNKILVRDYLLYANRQKRNDFDHAFLLHCGVIKERLSRISRRYKMRLGDTDC